tara:strand:- start:7039 stop:7554 length:516 start_codon:yes stop_codon:yes gene_type:complete
MNDLVKYSLRFVAIILAQTLVLTQIELGQGVQLIIYPLFIFLLPVETSIISLLISAFFLGFGIDVFSNTYGLHTSSLLIFTMLRPTILRLFSSRDGYDSLLETNVFNMGILWFIQSFGSLLLIHHLWFFILEEFKFNDLGYILLKTILSVPLSFLICILVQYLFVNKPSSK